jgi:hypothetical protein
MVRCAFEETQMLLFPRKRELPPMDLTGMNLPSIMSASL